jgi:ABC-type bacteriocin/lantibiotic exporter with double-glycine peptidase domain
MLYLNMIESLVNYAREKAKNRQRFPVLKEVGLDLFHNHPTMIYQIFRLACEHNFLIATREDKTFFQVADPNGEWRTLSKEEWKKSYRHTRICLSCRRSFIPESKYIFRCASCKSIDDWECHYV